MPEAPPAASAIYGELIELINQLALAEGFAARKEEPPEGTSPIYEVKDKLERKYWATAAKMVESVVTADLPDNLTFSRDQELFLNFGFFTHESVVWSLEEVKKIYDFTQREGFYRVKFITDTLNACYRQTKRVDRMKQLVKEQAGIQKSIADHPEELGGLRKERDQEIRASLGPDAPKAVALFDKWESLIVPYLDMEAVSRQGGFSGKEQILKFNKLRDDLNAVRASISAVLNKYPEGKMGVEGFLESIQAKHREMQDLKLDLEMAENKIFKEEHEVKAINDSKCKEDLRGAVNFNKALMTISARKAGITPNAMPMKKVRFIKPDEIRAALAHIEDYDPNVFNNRRVKKTGRPEVVLCPGTGNGVYDFVNDRLLLPTMVPREPLESTAAAVCMYRDDIDQQLNERAMISAFKRDIKEHGKIRSAIKLRQLFFKYYLIWMVKEAKGIASLGREERAWFEYRIAPKKLEPRTPVELRNLNAKDMRAIRDQVAAKSPLAGEDHQKLAILSFHLEEKDKALAHIMEAYKQLPTSSDVLLNVGIIHKAMNKDAKPYLQKYLTSAEQSWWTKKAQELMR
ncbi:MAG: hypothetical protein HY719_02890 [Planctomycetes bacterium]|nr:hypothetical protein [Planctomycetota bacterium]